MNRYEVTVVDTLGHEPRIIGTWTTHAGSPHVALNKVAKRLTYPKMPPGKMMSMKFDVTNQGKVIWIGEVEKPWMKEYILTSEPMPEGWGKVVRTPNGHEKIVT